jgi:hypothetical protein
MTAGVANNERQLKCISKNRLRLIFVANRIEIHRNKSMGREPSDWLKKSNNFVDDEGR